MTTINLTNAAVGGSEITNDHFGVNANFYWQTEGGYDASAAILMPETVRYPGGSVTEDYFDITNPDATIIVKDGITKSLIPMNAFLADCYGSSIQPIIVIPMRQLSTTDPSVSWRPIVWDSGMEAALITFVTSVLTQMGTVGVSAFELGNEYEALGWSGVEYGRVASSAARVVQETIDAYSEGLAAGVAYDEPDILVQIRGDANDGGTTDTAGLQAANEAVLGEFDAVELAAIDGTSSHFYFKDGKHAGTDYEHTYENLDQAMERMFDMAQYWQDNTDKELIQTITEWNIQHESTYTGMTQLAPMLEMFHQFTLNGAEKMDLWSMQFQNTSTNSPDYSVGNMNRPQFTGG